MRVRWLVMVAAAACLVAMAAVSGRVLADPIAVVDGQPIELTADRLEIDLKARTAVVVGNVRIKRGELVVTSEQVSARYDTAPNIVWAKATGGVQAQLGELRARASEAELDLQKNTLELRGVVRLWQGRGWMEARRASIDIRTHRISLSQVSGAIPVGSAKAVANP